MTKEQEVVKELVDNTNSDKFVWNSEKSCLGNISWRCGNFSFAGSGIVFYKYKMIISDFRVVTPLNKAIKKQMKRLGLKTIIDPKINIFLDEALSELGGEVKNA